MANVKVPLIGISDSGRSKDQNSHRAINLMPQVSQTGGKEQFYWVATPGLKDLSVTLTTVQPQGGPILARDMLVGMETVVFNGDIANADSGIYLAYYEDENVAQTTMSALAYYRVPFGGGTANRLNSIKTTENYWQTTLGNTFHCFATSAGYFVDVFSKGVVCCPPDDTATSSFDESVPVYIKYFSNEIALVSVTNDTGGFYTAVTLEPHGMTAGPTQNVIIKGTAGFNDTLLTAVATPTTTSFTFSLPDDSIVTEDPVGPDGYVYCQDPTLTINFGSVVYKDGYFVATSSSVGENRFWVSYPGDPRIWIYANNGAAERDPDGNARVISFNGLLWFLGQSTVETYANAGDGNQPFIPNRAIAYEWGCMAANSVGQYSDGFAFLARTRRGTPTVVLCDGHNIKPITDPALDYWLAKIDTTKQLNNIYCLANVSAFAYAMEGKEYYQITFQTGSGSTALDHTWCFDITTSFAAGIPCWHECQDSTGDRHKAQFYAFDPKYNRHVVSDYADIDRFYYLDLDYAGEGEGSTAQYVDRTGVSGHVSLEGKAIFHHSVVLEMENPVGSGDVILSWSDDGGNTFNTGQTRSFTGRGTRVEFFGLGMARQSRVYKLVFADCTTPVNVFSAYANVTQGLR